MTGYWFFVPSVSGKTNRAFFPTLTEAIARARINQAEVVYYRDDNDLDKAVMKVRQR